MALWAAMLEKFDFTDIVLSLKASDVITMIESYRLVAEKCDYPLHLGVTEAGTEYKGVIKNSHPFLYAIIFATISFI